MLFGKRVSPEEQQRSMQEQQDAQASQRLLETGRLPLQAKRRLSIDLAAGHPLFTSDLSSREFALTRLQGYRPLSQVMGSSIYHVGWYARPYGDYSDEMELTTISQAHQRAAQLALSRLDQEAALLKAHGVIGVRLTTRDYEWGRDLLEFTAIGTAIRLPNTPLPQRPFLSDLSGQEFWTLLQAGYVPVGVVTGYCVYYVGLIDLETMPWREIVDFTRGIRLARSAAMRRVTEMARQLKASGVVGMHIECKREIKEERKNRHSLWVHFSVVGTAIGRKFGNHVIPKPRPTLSLTAVRPGQYGETRELTIRGE
jgi:uncharacterized protein YbjQ (UPF0145 family)